MLKKVGALDLVIFLALAFGIFSSIVLTRVDIIYMGVALPLILSLKIFIQKENLREIIPIKNKFFLFNIFLLTLMPIVIEAIHGEGSLVHKSYWLHAKNTFIIPAFFISSFLFISITKKIFKDNKLAEIFPTLLISVSFIVDFIYAIVKEIKFDEFGGRWEGSANNPNVWAVQASLVLFLLIASRKGFQANNKLIAAFNILAVFPLAAVLATRSITNLLALGIGVTPIVWAWSSYLLIPLIILVVFLSSYILFGEIHLDRSSLIFAKKIYPRLKIWYLVNDFFKHTDFNALIGIGYEKFSTWSTSTNARAADHVHNAYLQYFLMYGLAGLYANFAYLYNLAKENKYTLGLVFYVLVSSCFDVSFFFYESQILFWVILPFILKKS